MFRWKDFTVKRFYGLDLQTNIVDVLDGKALDCDNVFLDFDGVVSKRPGEEPVFNKDEAGSIAIDEIGTCVISGTKYWFKFSDGKFHYATARDGAVTTITPNPAISTVNQIWWVALDDKLFFVDGTNELRFFDGTNIKVSSIYQRPTTVVGLIYGGTAGVPVYDYSYTIDNGLGESPAWSGLRSAVISGGIHRVTDNTGPHTLVVGDRIRIYGKVNTVAIGFKNITKTTGSDAYGVYESDESGGYYKITNTNTFYDVNTDAISDTQPQLYSELGLALNKSAPTGLTGITKHYSRLVGWKDQLVYNSKVTNPHSWPDITAQSEAFVYGVSKGDGETIQRCITYRENLYVMKPSEIFIFGGIGPDDTGNNAYTFRRLETNGNGCIAPKSAVVVGEQGNLTLVYLSANGFMATNGDSPVLVGEEINSEIRSVSNAILATSCAVHDRKFGIYVCAVGSTGNKTLWVLDVRKETVANIEIYFGWFKWELPKVKSMFFDNDRILFGRSDGICSSQRVSGLSTDFRDIQQEYVNAASVNDGADTLTVTGSFETADPVILRTSETIPGGLTANQTYYVILVNATTIRLATTAQNALSNTYIDITTQGVGVHSLIKPKAISAHYTTNWINFRHPLVVKKLSKPGIVFNALAPQVQMNIETAYDWVSNFSNTGAVLGGANEGWGDNPWGGGNVWGGGAVASPKNYALPRRKVRSIQFKFSNNELDQDFNLQSLNLPFDYIRNRGGY